MRRIVVALSLVSKDGNRRRDRWARRTPLLCTITCAIGLIIASALPKHDPGWGSPIPLNPAFFETGVTGADVAGFIEEPIGEADFARLILDATTESAGSDTCLVYAWRSDIGMTFTYMSGGWPQSIVHRSAREQQGFVASSRPTTRFNWGQHRVSMAVRWEGLLWRTENTSVSLVQAAPVALGLGVLWIATGFGVWLVGWTVRRRTAKRINRGLCVQCGYDLSGPTRGEETSTRT